MLAVDLHLGYVIDPNSGHLSTLETDPGAQVRVVQRPDTQVPGLYDVFFHVVGLGMEV